MTPKVENASSPVFIDLFAGCGGLSLGMMRAGWKGLFAIEKDAHAFETLRTNLIDRPTSGDEHHLRYFWPDWLPREPMKVRTFLSRYREQIAGLRGKVDVIVGGPPCQGFSFAGDRDKHDTRNVLFKQYVEVVDLVRPKFLLLENVRAITTEFGKKRRQVNKIRRGRPPKPFSQRIREKLEAIGYRVETNANVWAVNYGVPQLRPRFIAVGVDTRQVASEIELTYFDLLSSRRETFLESKGIPRDRPVSVADAISDLERKNRRLEACPEFPKFKQIVYTGPKTDYQRLLHGSMGDNAPDGLRLAVHTPEVKRRFREILRTCRKGVQLSPADRKRLRIKKLSLTPLDPNRPSHTLTTLPEDLLHYQEPRILTLREWARLQTFPDWFQFRGKYAAGGHNRGREAPRYTQVGNAVPPLLAEILGTTLLDVHLLQRSAPKEAVAHAQQPE